MHIWSRRWLLCRRLPLHIWSRRWPLCRRPPLYIWLRHLSLTDRDSRGCPRYRCRPCRRISLACLTTWLHARTCGRLARVPRSQSLPGGIGIRAVTTGVTAAVCPVPVGVRPIGKADVRIFAPLRTVRVAVCNSRPRSIARRGLTRAICSDICPCTGVIIRGVSSPRRIAICVSPPACGTIVVPAVWANVMISHCPVCRARAATLPRTPVIAVTVAMSFRPVAVMHVPVVVDRNTRAPVIMTVVIAAVVRMTPVARMIDVQVTV